MPGLSRRNASQSVNAAPISCSAVGRSAGVWSKKQEDVGFDQLHKFWSGLLPHARRELLRIDKHMLFEQARKNVYCSRCNGLLLEGFSQIVTFGKSLQLQMVADGGDAEEEKSLDMVDPSLHPWGGLIASRDGILTLMDCYLHGGSLWVLQNVFDNARAREHERELLYPDACGGSGRGWISHGMTNCGRIHGARETCALHTARLSCDTLVDFWLALGDETQTSLFCMKEEDFIERLMHRFDSKRFCRDCRKNVIREFKELKELKRIRRETRCTTWFCAADLAFQYEVWKDKVWAGWHQSFADLASLYHHYEWAIGSGEGKTDILAYEDVGLATEVLADGLELGGIDVCYITLRACRLDGRHVDLSVKAHALKGKSCVHQQLAVGDGFIRIAKRESIRSFFDHAEEAEDEEDDDTTDKDTNDFDTDGSRPQKHAKSPELAREFLLDAATVIFKGQVEKAFREGTARQNAHSLFICLALKLLEERLHIACKEIITFEKQAKLLEEEEKEKREEEERRERRRAKEREKKLRRKERLREKEHENEGNDSKTDQLHISHMLENSSVSHREAHASISDEDSISNEVKKVVSAKFTSPATYDNQNLEGFVGSIRQKMTPYTVGGEHNDWERSGSFTIEQTRSSRRRLRFNRDVFSEKGFEWSEKGCDSTLDAYDDVQHSGSEFKSSGCSAATSGCKTGGYRYHKKNIAKINSRSPSLKFHGFLVLGSKRSQCRHDYHSSSCHPVSGYRVKDSQSAVLSNHENKAISSMGTPVRLRHSNRQSPRVCIVDGSATPKEKPGFIRANINRDNASKRQVWEPTDMRKKTPGSTVKILPMSRGLTMDSIRQNEEVEVQNHSENSLALNVLDEHCLSIHSKKSTNPKDLAVDADVTVAENLCVFENSFNLDANACYCKVNDDEFDSFSASPTSPLNNGCDLVVGTSSSDNCSSCISEVDSIGAAKNAECSSTSDPEDVSQPLEGGVISVSKNKDCLDAGEATAPSVNTATGLQFDSSSVSKMVWDVTFNGACKSGASDIVSEMGQLHQQMPFFDNHSTCSAFMHFPTMGYADRHPPSWPATASGGMVPHYLFQNPYGYSMPVCQPLDYHVNFCNFQPLTNPAPKVNWIPTGAGKNGIGWMSNDQMRNYRAVGSNGMPERSDILPSSQRQLSEKQGNSGPSSGRDGHCVKNWEKLQEDFSTFSLFHFNGPVAIASPNGLDTSQSEKKTVPLTDSDRICSEQGTVVEEYSLFASSNGSRFSFF